MLWSKWCTFLSITILFYLLKINCGQCVLIRSYNWTTFNFVLFCCFRPTHWKQNLFMLDNGLIVEKGDNVQGYAKISRHAEWRRHLRLFICFTHKHLSSGKVSLNVFLFTKLLCCYTLIHIHFLYCLNKINLLMWTIFRLWVCSEMKSWFGHEE